MMMNSRPKPPALSTGTIAGATTSFSLSSSPSLISSVPPPPPPAILTLALSSHRRCSVSCSACLYGGRSSGFGAAAAALPVEYDDSNLAKLISHRGLEPFSRVTLALLSFAANTQAQQREQG